MSAPDPTFVRPPSQWRELWLSRLRGFVREPGVLFWVFGFPLVLSVVLGLAFREKGPERFAVVLVEGGAGSADLGKALRASPLLAVTEAAPAAAEASLARAEALVLVRPGATRPELSYDPTRPGTEAAAALVRMALLPAPPDGTPPGAPPTLRTEMGSPARSVMLGLPPCVDERLAVLGETLTPGRLMLSRTGRCGSMVVMPLRSA